MRFFSETIYQEYFFRLTKNLSGSCGLSCLTKPKIYFRSDSRYFPKLFFSVRIQVSSCCAVSPNPPKNEIFSETIYKEYFFRLTKNLRSGSCGLSCLTKFKKYLRSDSRYFPKLFFLAKSETYFFRLNKNLARVSSLGGKV